VVEVQVGMVVQVITAVVEQAVVEMEVAQEIMAQPEQITLVVAVEVAAQELQLVMQKVKLGVQELLLLDTNFSS
tara:strand:- start:29 stop:250 length:222 start_codon:yes stop_codon:yes gene_type:complete